MRLMKPGWWLVPWVSVSLLLQCVRSDVDKGNDCLTLGDWEMAAGFFEKRLHDNPRDYQARLGLGKALIQKATFLEDDTTSWRQALINFEAARTIRPDTTVLPLLAQCWLTFGRKLLVQTDTLAGLSAIARSIAYDPAHPEALNAAAIIYHRLGNDKRAMVLFEQALQADSAFVPALFNLGLICLEQDQVDAAHRHLLAALTLDPSDEDILFWFAAAEKRLRESEATP